MIIKAHIEVRLNNNDVIKYVNSTVQDTMGENTKYYSYTNEAGDQYADQIGSGKAKGDFDNLVGQLGGTGLLIWPEGGTELVRKNLKQNMASVSTVRSSVAISQIVSIKLEEQEINEWQQLDHDRRNNT